MGDLPADRVKGYTRPFTITGVDYAGPLQVRDSRHRGRIHVYKTWMAVLFCFSTKAGQLITDLTTEGFLAALSRFTARRGQCTQLPSDNGPDFVEASRELERVFEFLRDH